jgi:tetratricopeptide repeat protein 21B
MIADIMYKKVSFSYAVFHLQQLLSQKPTHYLALSKLVDLLRRIGKLEEAEKYFEQLSKGGFKVQSHPGYCYCKGLFMK